MGPSHRLGWLSARPCERLISRPSAPRLASSGAEAECGSGLRPPRAKGCICMCIAEADEVSVDEGASVEALRTRAKLRGGGRGSYRGAWRGVGEGW